MQKGCNEEEATISVINFYVCCALKLTFLMTGKYDCNLFIKNSMNEIPECLLSMLIEFTIFLFI
jgi:hypothetical protein